jgi:hypothetical protein
MGRQIIIILVNFLERCCLIDTKTHYRVIKRDKANKNRLTAVVLHFGGGEESRTPVQEVSHIQSSTV